MIIITIVVFSTYTKYALEIFVGTDSLLNVNCKLFHRVKHSNSRRVFIFIHWLIQISMALYNMSALVLLRRELSLGTLVIILLSTYFSRVGGRLMTYFFFVITQRT